MASHLPTPFVGSLPDDLPFPEGKQEYPRGFGAPGVLLIKKIWGSGRDHFGETTRHCTPPYWSVVLPLGNPWLLKSAFFAHPTNAAARLLSALPLPTFGSTRARATGAS